MRDFNPRGSVRPKASHFAGAANGGSFVRSPPRSLFSDAEEMELASKLLQVTSEAGLEQVLRDLFKKAWRGIEPAGPKVIGPLGGVLKMAAKKALPSVAPAAGMPFGGPAGMTAADRDLEKCRQLFETSRQFVRSAGKAARAAASAPTGVSPIAAAQKILADSAKEKLTRKAASAGLAGIFAGHPLAAAAMKPAAAPGRMAAEKPPTGIQAPGGRICSICELSPGSCQCRKIGRSGRWFRNGSNIVVNC
jgi:hypothetical protein